MTRMRPPWRSSDAGFSAGSMPIIGRLSSARRVAAATLVAVLQAMRTALTCRSISSAIT